MARPAPWRRLRRSRPMGSATAEISISATLAEVWSQYFDAEGWRVWVDGFAAVEASAGYPLEGGSLIWRSRPQGRGTVEERVLAHEPRRLHRIAFADEHSQGEMETRFAIEGSVVRIEQTVTYSLARQGALGPLTDILFVRPQIRRSLQRSLERFRYEAEFAALPAIDTV